MGGICGLRRTLDWVLKAQMTTITDETERATMDAVLNLRITTESAADKKQAGKEAGATGWIVKPFNLDILLNTIATVLPV
ncbi:MAG: hypothetical protein P0121_11020 [Nitrospira sp.]|nr:hypothetical protein [Nitrospira sp.]